MSIGPMFEIKLNPAWVETMTELGKRLNESIIGWQKANAIEFKRLEFPALLGPDIMAEIEQRVEDELALRRDEAARLTRAAHTYGYRDAKVVWLQDPCQFAFIHLDGLVCADIPQIGDDYASALRWIREEVRDE